MTAATMHDRYLECGDTPGTTTGKMALKGCDVGVVGAARWGDGGSRRVVNRMDVAPAPAIARRKVMGSPPRPPGLVGITRLDARQ